MYVDPTYRISSSFSTVSHLLKSLLLVVKDIMNRFLTNLLKAASLLSYPVQYIEITTITLSVTSVLILNIINCHF